MKKIVSIVILSLTIIIGCTIEQPVQAICYRNDGIDKRISQVREFLRVKISKKELQALSFTEAVVHIKDSINFYMKIPFINKKYPGFLLVKKEKTSFRYVKVVIEGYHYNNKRLRDKSRYVTISSKDKKLNKKFIIYGTGRVEKMLYPVPKNGIKDTAFSFIPFLGYGSVKPNDNDMISPNLNFDEFESYIDTNFIFDSIDSLNYHKLHTKVFVHDMIPLSFETRSSFTLEYSNSDILPAIDIRKLFGTVDSKADSIKKQ